MQSQVAYVPVADPTEAGPQNPGRIQGIIGMILGVVVSSALEQGGGFIFGSATSRL